LKSSGVNDMAKLIQEGKTWRADFLRFVDLGKLEGGITHRYEVWSDGGDLPCMLGWIEWKSVWRRYTFRPILESSTWFDFLCLTMMADFCKMLTDERKTHWGQQGRFASQ
jgi:hypothetical protein